MGRRDKLPNVASFRKSQLTELLWRYYAFDPNSFKLSLQAISAQ